MVTTEVSNSYQSFQILKTLTWQHVDDLTSKANHPKLVLDDIIFMHALATTVQSFCEIRRGFSLSAVMIGYHANILVASIDGKNFRYFYNLKYEKEGDEAQSLEACINALDEHQRPRRFFCYRSQKIKITGKEIVNANLVDVNENVTGLFAAVIQHEVENQNYNFLPNYGIEVSIY